MDFEKLAIEFTGESDNLYLEKCKIFGSRENRAMGYFEDILHSVRRIPKGKVASYGAVARAAGHPGMARQVAWALRSSKAGHLHWHRVIGSGGRILLSGVDGLHQRTLLELEGVPFRGSRVDISRCEFRFEI
jgi:alkylated DNA nucleotide flippase Atl1